MQLENKVVIPAGSASGFGRECALACAREGASVVVAPGLSCDLKGE
jgi:NAD(P)-dependent dehydrogenase (short-subunit alcohol dehydrogenase family)